MGLSFALDELRATGWSALDSAGCSFDADGRTYPTVSRITQEFAIAGFDLVLAQHPNFNCVRASWRGAGEASDAGFAVGQTEAEAAVYALAQLRRSLATA